MSKKIFYAFLVLIILLIAFNVRLNYLDKSLEKGCVNDYSEYLNNGTCPCKPTRINYDPLNISNVNVSVEKQR
jgi:hypothetical protein